MATKLKATEQPKALTFEFKLTQTEDPREWVGSYSRNGEVVFEITAPNTYQYVAAVLERRLRLAIHE